MCRVSDIQQRRPQQALLRPTVTDVAAALPYGQAVRVARRMGLVVADATAIDHGWRPLWWALSEIGWLEESLVDRLDAAAGWPDGVVARQRVGKLVAAGWLAGDRSRTRPARALVVTHQGRIDLPSLPRHAPPWTASTLEVARRALAEVLRTETEPLETSAAAERVIGLATRWGRLVRERDAREILLQWRHAGLIRSGAAARRRWLITPPGRQSLRAVARAVKLRLPRQPRLQDEDHDLQLARLVEQLTLSHPGIIGTLRVARRAWLDPKDNHTRTRRWIVPDGLVGFHTTTGPLVLALEVERRGRYDNLARHAHNYGQLAGRWPHHRLRILVVTARTSTRRQLVLADAVAELTADPVSIAAAITTPRSIGPHLAGWNIRPWTPTFTPPE